MDYNPLPRAAPLMPDFGLEITPRLDSPAIVARLRRAITVPEPQAGYLAILAAADATGCPSVELFRKSFFRPSVILSILRFKQRRRMTVVLTF